MLEILLLIIIMKKLIEYIYFDQNANSKSIFPWPWAITQRPSDSKMLLSIYSNIHTHSTRDKAVMFNEFLFAYMWLKVFTLLQEYTLIRKRIWGFATYIENVTFLPTPLGILFFHFLLNIFTFNYTLTSRYPTEGKQAMLLFTKMGRHFSFYWNPGLNNTGIRQKWIQVWQTKRQSIEIPQLLDHPEWMNNAPPALVNWRQ